MDISFVPSNPFVRSTLNLKKISIPSPVAKFSPSNPVMITLFPCTVVIGVPLLAQLFSNVKSLSLISNISSIFPIAWSELFVTTILYVI